jgi:Protein of unknown function (DUF3383)
MSNLPVSDFVNVQISLSALPAAAASFSGGLIVGSAARLPLGARVQAFTKDTYGSIFSSADPEYTALQMAFSQNPAPATRYVGRRFSSAAGGYLQSDGYASLTALKAITAGAFDITLDGTLVHVTGLDLHLVTDMADVATALQSAIAHSCTVTYQAADGNGIAAGLCIHSATTGAASQVSYGVIVNSGSPSAPDPTATLLGLTLDAGASRTVGVAAESMSDSLNALKIASADWYSFTTTSDTLLADQILAATWAEAAEQPYFGTSMDPLCYNPSDQTALAGYCKAHGFSHTFVQFSTDTADAAGSAMARLNIVDYTQPASTIDLFGKQEPGVTPEPLTETQKEALDANNCNYYANVGGYAMLALGNMSNGRAADEVVGLDWLQSQAQSLVFAALATQPTKLPQTDAGVAALEAALESALQMAVTNGLLAPGYWPKTNVAVGEVNPGQFLPKGYYIFAQPVALQNSLDRAARLSPPITAIACGAGALRKCLITINFSR